MKKKKPSKKPTLRQKKENSRRSSEEVNALKERMIAVKKVIGPKSKGGVSLFISRFPDFDTYKLSSKVANVYNLVIVDEDITEKFEQLQKEIEENN